MQYIVMDLEFNQDLTMELPSNLTKYPYEIIQIGAVKLDSNLTIVSTFDRYVKPTIYEKVSPFIVELTGIETYQLLDQEPFPVVFQDFMNFIGKEDVIFGIWGMADMKELYRNAQYHQLEHFLTNVRYINIQPYVSIHFGFPSNQLLRLQYAVTALDIPEDYPYHDAYHDAYYTAEILKKIFHMNLQPKIYDPNTISIKIRKPKKVIDYEGLFQQFEKMYDRELTLEEKDMITLAYKMGKTGQFLLDN